ncbi:MAG: site-2 protease family protein [Pirellulaceae bacterium]
MSLIAATSTDPTIWQQILSWTWVVFSVGAGLGFVIFVHELGHFLVAKACGVKCEKFYVGFDWFPIKRIGPFTIPHSLFRKQWGETVYGIGILPLGGYVKMLGQDDDPRNAEAEAERSKVLKDGTAVEGLTPGATVEKEYVLDPRSYQAKSVPARMAIISAGVIMNLIFGVLLAALAYGIGVPEMPAIIGGTVPASPAWEKLEPGMRAVQFNKGAAPYENFRFQDMKRKVVFNGDDRDLEILFRDEAGKEEWFRLRPSGRTKEETDFPSLGFYSAASRRLAVSAKQYFNRLDKDGDGTISKDEAPERIKENFERVDANKDGSIDAEEFIKDPNSVEGLENNDILVAIEGQELEPDQGKFDSRVNAELARRPSGPLKVTVERAEKKEGAAIPERDAPKHRVEVILPQRPKQTIGVVMKIGPVVSIRENSPAAKAGFQIGDVIEKVNGEEVGDPLSLGQRLIPSSEAETFDIVVARKDAKGKRTTAELKVNAVPPREFQDAFPYGGPTTIESIGVAFDVTNEIAAIEPGSSAEKQGLKAGDVAATAQLVAASEEARKLEVSEGYLEKEFGKLMKLDNNLRSWTRVHHYLQHIRPDTKLELTVLRGKDEVKVTLTPEDSQTFFDERRGLVFRPIEIKHQAAGVVEAFSLGFREVREQLGTVLMSLSHLVTRRISAKHLTGPAGIIEAAGNSAGHSFPMLLMFLVMLSANLAIINFLPIPVLDGGHMLFLAAEGIRRKPVPPHIQGWLSIGGLAFLLSLMVFATAMDVQRWFQ